MNVARYALPLPRIFCFAIFLSLVGGLWSPAQATDRIVEGEYWYVFDFIRSVADDARIKLLVSLPTTRDGQEISIEHIDPKPAAIIEDHDQGNRLVAWELSPSAADTFLACHFRFRARLSRILNDVDPDLVQPYDRDSQLYRRYTRSEYQVETDGEVQQLANAIVGQQTHPYRQARLFYDWLIDNMEFWPGGTEDRSARATSLGHRGDCGQFSLLLTALCRTQGIPARTVTCEWLTGGKHRWAEFYLPPYGWLPADPSAAQMLKPGFKALSREEILAFMRQHDIPPKDTSWLFGNLYRDRLIICVGNNIEVRSPGDASVQVYTALEPGGSDASPPAVRIDGLNEDLVHGGFYVFDENELDTEAAHRLAHVRLARKYFLAGRYDVAEQGCLKALDANPDEIQSWISLGRVYLHKGQYYKAEASFLRALEAVAYLQSDKMESRIWTHNYLGNCYDLLGSRELAIAEYQKVVKLNQNYHGALDYARKYLNHPFTTSEF